MTSLDVIEKVGRLTKVGSVAGLVKAMCDCGYPSVFVEEADWSNGSVLGCANCHGPEAERITKEKEREAREAEASKRAEERKEMNRQIYFLPHFEDLTFSQKKLFKLLSHSPSFTCETVGSMLRCEASEAWTAIYPILEANCLTEYTGVFGEKRPYSYFEPYTTRASSASRYSCRPMAIMQMQALEEEQARKAEERASRQAPPSMPDPAVVGDVDLKEVKSWIAENCVAGEGLSESDIMLRARYVADCKDQEPIEPEAFRDALEKAGYPLRGGKRRGLRLKLIRELASAASS